MKLFKKFKLNKKNKTTIIGTLAYIIIAALLINGLIFFSKHYYHSGLLPY